MGFVCNFFCRLNRRRIVNEEELVDTLSTVADTHLVNFVGLDYRDQVQRQFGIKEALVGENAKEAHILILVQL